MRPVAGLDNMNKKLSTVLPKNAFLHIDMIHVSGTCRHAPIGVVKYDYDEDLGPIPSIAFGINKALKAGSKEKSFIKSQELTDDGYANKLEMRFCPLKVLQNHNVYGHGDLVDYVYHLFDHATRELGIEVSDHDRELWRQGFVWLTEVHVTGNFGCHARHIGLVIDAVDQNNKKGKQRPLDTSVSLGFHGMRRSRNVVATIYYKLAELDSAWKTRDHYQKLLMESVRNAIRCEIKLYDKALKTLKLQYAANWKGIDVAALFFSELDKFQVKYAIQPMMTPEQMEKLTKTEQNVYLLWLSGKAVKDQFKSRWTAWKYCKLIQEKTGHNLRGDRRPDALPAINLADIFCPDNLLPIPAELMGTEHYFPPGQPDLPLLRKGASGDFDPAADRIIVVDGQRIVI